MKYTINDLAKLAGVSTRTLRYYDQINLLKPEKTGENGYRIYGQVQVDLLQQIMFYKELEVPLCQIKSIIYSSDFIKLEALEKHLNSLLDKKQMIDKLIDNVSKTIKCEKGETTMSNKEKFEGFKKDLINKNEQQYGEEIRQKYGDNVIDASNDRISNMSEADWNGTKELEAKIADLLKIAVKEGDPSSENAQKACDFHKQWICKFWGEKKYNSQAHKMLGEMYVSDERFKKYYENITPGCAEFLRDALKIYCK